MTTHTQTHTKSHSTTKTVIEQSLPCSSQPLVLNRIIVQLSLLDLLLLRPPMQQQLFPGAAVVSGPQPLVVPPLVLGHPAGAFQWARQCASARLVIYQKRRTRCWHTGPRGGRSRHVGKLGQERNVAVVAEASEAARPVDPVGDGFGCRPNCFITVG